MKKESGAGHFQITIKVPRKGTEREKQVLLEIVSRNLGPVLCGEDFRQKYERACFEKLSSSDSKRRAFNFVRQWYNLTTLAREARDTVKSKELKALAAPLMDALGKRDAEFFKGLAEAMRILEQREISSKTKYPGNLDKWLLEYAIENGWTLPLTAREFKKQIVSNSGASRLINCGENANVLAFSLSRMREARQLRDTGSLPGTKPICDPHPDKKVVFCEIR